MTSTVFYQQQSPLFKRLPGEVRNEIWRWCKPELDSFDGPVSVLEDTENPSSCSFPLPAVLMTCKRIYKEAFSFICDTMVITVVEVSILREMTDGEVASIQFIGNLRPENIRHLTLNYSAARWRSQFDRCVLDFISNAENIRRIDVNISEDIRPRNCEGTKPNNLCLSCALRHTPLDELARLIAAPPNVEHVEIGGYYRSSWLKGLMFELRNTYRQVEVVKKKTLKLAPDQAPVTTRTRVEPLSETEICCALVTKLRQYKGRPYQLWLRDPVEDYEEPVLDGPVSDTEDDTEDDDEDEAEDDGDVDDGAEDATTTLPTAAPLPLEQPALAAV
ncbi:hypothetical protein M426DRAFT_27972 [Hypoxylon sp. CI-4A]|nr:hypothetical protein M426DRAFT_27972 [Hypoxylon sp. CI-4A]